MIGVSGWQPRRSSHRLLAPSSRWSVSFVIFPSAFIREICGQSIRVDSPSYATGSGSSLETR
jgi:hypothetical protein